MYIYGGNGGKSYMEKVKKVLEIGYVHRNNGEQFYEGERKESEPKRGMEKSIKRQT